MKTTKSASEIRKERKLNNAKAAAYRARHPERAGDARRRTDRARRAKAREEASKLPKKEKPKKQAEKKPRKSVIVKVDVVSVKEYKPCHSESAIALRERFSRWRKSLV